MEDTHSEELKSAVRNLLISNMGFKPGERLLIVGDLPRTKDWQDSHAQHEDILQRAQLARKITDLACSLFPENSIDFVTFSATGQNGAEPPDWVAKQMLAYDVILLPTTFSLTHTKARASSCEQGGRVASMPGIETDMFLENRPMQADYSQVSRDCDQWAEKLTLGNQVQIITSQGTDLAFSISGRNGRVDNGLFSKPGAWGNLPAGEAYIVPIEGTANGRLVVPAGWYPHLAEDLVLTFKDGHAISAVGGGSVGDELRKALNFGDEVVRHRRNCAEFGIGTNPFASRTDNVLEAEKIRGTIHIAVGDSIHLGGLIESDLHEDFIIPQPTIIIDGTPIYLT